MLAEYDENGSLTTYYTRGEELISQERGGEKHYYLYDGFDSVRMLTDEDGSVTDTYTFDAFGNLTASTGDTENSYLYRGEQFDSFTGLYYLRARYMNPTTGTFITMDEYAGSVFEPVSLHKYLYANANPVMFSDPSGYLSVSELSASMAIQGIIGGIVSAGINILTFLNTAEPGDKFDWNNFWGSVIGGFIFGAGFGAVGTYAMAVKSAAIMTALGFSSLTFAAMSAIQSIEYGQEGEYELAITYWILTAIGLVGTAKSFNQAYQFSTARTTAATTTQNTASNTSCAKGDACFVGSTAVATEDGKKRIDEIEIGDKVWAYNVETGETELKSVTKVYVHSVDEILHLYTDEGDIDTTANHPFYVIGKGWVAAGDLVEGDEVYNLDGTTSVVLSSEIEVLDEPVLVYNIEVEDLHSYFVGCVPVLVHNYDVPVKKITKTPNGLLYQSNPKHTPGGAGNRPNAGIEPRNSLKLFCKSVPSSEKPNVRFTYDSKTKTLHRFFGNANGVWHWSGSTNQGKYSLTKDQVPSDIIKHFNINAKGW